MILADGIRLGPYEIIAPIGAGGMGEVYKARDTRLDRTVALKILPPGAADDPQRLRRFEQEARAVAALSHPNICALHDIGHEAPSHPGSEAEPPLAVPVHFLVMEYLEGETLAQRLRQRKGGDALGAIPLNEALEYGAQIADALARAHRQGIIHRDLKPANVMLLKAGARAGTPHVKLLDFGLAKLKAAPGNAAAGGVSGLATRTALTRPGTVMGTVPYMAPEQIEGKEGDSRTDLFALGCVLYELLTGRRAFEGTSNTSVMAAILSSEPPPVSALLPLTAPALDRLVRRCLAKDPEARWQHAADVAEELRGISQDSQTPPVMVTRPARRRTLTLAVVGTLVVLLASAAAVGWLVRGRASGTPPNVIPLALPPDVKLALGYVPFAFAPDGSGEVWTAVKGAANTRFLYWSASASPESPRELWGTEGAEQPFFSPDSHWLGFARDGKLFKLPFRSGRILEGSKPTALASAPDLRGASWGEDGTILFCPQVRAGLWQVSSETGRDARPVTTPDSAKGEMSHRWPHFLPGGRAALFTVLDVSSRPDRHSVAVLSLETGQWTRILSGASDARYLPSGHIVYGSNNRLFAAPFDLGTLKVLRIPAIPVLTGVQQPGGGPGAGGFDVSPNGALLYAPGLEHAANDSLVWIGPDGRADPVTPDRRAYHPNFSLSPDDDQLAAGISLEEGSDLLHICTLATRQWRQLTHEGSVVSPVWSPHGDQLVFGWNKNGVYNLFTIRTDTEGAQPEQRTYSDQWQYPYAWSPDGKFIAYQETGVKSGWSTFILPTDTWAPTLWDREGANVTLPAFSPDGHWLAYQSQSRETGTFEVYVSPFPGPGEKVRISGGEGGLAPIWSRDGDEILYVPERPVDDRRVFGVRVDTTGHVVKPLERRVAFALPFSRLSPGAVQSRVMALSKDGQRILTIMPDPEARASSLGTHFLSDMRVITNWAEQVKAILAGQR